MGEGEEEKQKQERQEECVKANCLGLQPTRTKRKSISAKTSIVIMFCCTHR